MVADIQHGNPKMTDKEIFAAGQDGYKREWKNIPPFSIASTTRDMKTRLTSAEIWRLGWLYKRYQSAPTAPAS